MGALKNKSVKSLLEGIDDFEAENKRRKGKHLNDIKSLHDELLNTDSKSKRDKLISEFKKKNAEFAEFMESNPELIESEVKKALLIAAVGGEYSEEKITVDSRGRKKISRTNKTAVPDVNAALELLDMIGGSESAESSMADAWINALLEGDENEQEKQV